MHLVQQVYCLTAIGNPDFNGENAATLCGPSTITQITTTQLRDDGVAAATGSGGLYGVETVFSVALDPARSRVTNITNRLIDDEYSLSG